MEYNFITYEYISKNELDMQIEQSIMVLLNYGEVFKMEEIVLNIRKKINADIPYGRVAQILCSLVNSKKIKRIKQGFYCSMTSKNY